MLCYVGKATKIFFLVVAVLAAAGLVLGFGLLRHGWAHRANACDAGGCKPTTVPDPVPAVTTPASPAAASTTAADPAAAPPPLPFPPPGNPSAALGPAHF